MEIPPVGAELLHADRQTDMTKLIDDIRDFTKAPKNGSHLLLYETPHLQKLQVYNLRQTAVVFTVMWFIAHAQKEHSHRTSACCPTGEKWPLFSAQGHAVFCWRGKYR